MLTDLNIIPLSWDSEFFQMKVGKVVLSSQDDWRCLSELICKKQPFDLIYVFSPINLFPTITTAKLVDSKVVYRKINLIDEQIIADGISQYNKDILDDNLYSLALICGAYSRYRKDTNFPSGTYERFYKKWIENSVKGNIADVLFCYSDGRTTKGMITIKMSGGVGNIGLLAVDSGCQGKGIGSILMKSAENWISSMGGDSIEVATQMQNTLACRFYEKNGYEIASITDIYHLWL